MPKVAMSLQIDEKLKRDLQALCKCYGCSLNMWIERELQFLVEAAKAELPRELDQTRERLKLYNELAMKFLELGPHGNLKSGDFENGMGSRDDIDRAVAEQMSAEESLRMPDPLSGSDASCDECDSNEDDREQGELKHSFVERQLERAKRDYNKLRDLTERLNDDTLPCVDIVNEKGFLTSATTHRIYAVAKALNTYAEDLGPGFGYGKVSITWTNVLNRRAAVSPAVRTRITTWLECKEQELATSAPTPRVDRVRNALKRPPQSPAR